MFLRNTEKLESLVGSDSYFKGDIKTKGTLRIDGTVDGHIEADWVILGEKSQIRGDVAARGVVVGGAIEGNVTAKEIIEIKGKGQVAGDIRTSKLSISEGGVFEGRSMMHREESNVVELSLKSKG